MLNQIKELRIKAGLTQVELANLLGVKQPCVAFWESGRSFPRSSLLPKLARILNCTVEQLLTEKSA